MKSKVKNKSKLAKELGVSRGSLYYEPTMPDKDIELARALCQPPLFSTTQLP